LNIIPGSIEGLLIIEPQFFDDQRGYFTEVYHHSRYHEAGIRRQFVQDNLSFSVKGTLRGLHFQVSRPQAKLVQVIAGMVFDVAADLRPDSPSFKQWLGFTLSDQNRRQLYIPEGFAHGFCVMSETAHLLYKCTDVYVPEDECGIIWSDPDLAIKWPVDPPLVSPKDARLPLLSQLSPDKYPRSDGS